MKKNFLTSNSFCFFVLVTAGCLLSAVLRYELWWDFINYHYYNPWAFLNGRLGFDIAPASINTYFNPLLDLPLYFLVQSFNDYPAFVSALQGMWWGLLLFVFYKINLSLWDYKTAKGKISLLMSMIIGATGFVTFKQMGTSTNEVQIALLVLWAAYLLIEELFETKGQRKPVIFASGFIMGAALGLKPTAIVYCLGAGLALMLHFWRINNPGQIILLFAAGGFCGFLLTNGFWMLKMWQEFQNPFFPFLNRIFKSPYFDDFNYSDTRYLPTQWYDYFLYPFKWAFHFKRVVGETEFIDIRFALMTVLVILWIIAARKKGCESSQKLVFLAVFCLFSYFLWLTGFAIIRYLIPVEMMAAVFIMKSFWYWLPPAGFRQIIYLSVSVFLAYMLISVPYQSARFGKRGTDGKIIKAEPLEIPEKALIVLYNFPTAALLPIYAGNKPEVRALGMKHLNSVVMKGSNFSDRGKMAEQKNEIIQNHKGPIVVFVRKVFNFHKLFNAKTDVLVKDMFCRPLAVNFNPMTEICVPKSLQETILKGGLKDEK